MKDDKALKKVLAAKMAIIQNKLPKSALKEVNRIMYDKYNVQASRVIDIFNGFEPIENLPYHMLYKLMMAIKEVGIKRRDFDYSDLVYDQYFNENEEIEYSKPIPKEEEDIDIEIDDWHLTNVGMYSYYDIHVTIDDVMKWYYYGKLKYNPDTQRDQILIETDGIPIYKLDINSDTIEEIKKAMIDGSYFSVPGTLNLNPELYDEYPIKIQGKKLIINRKFNIDLIEGYHNYWAYTGAKRENKDWKYPCDFRLYVMNVEDANRYILQMDKKNHFKSTQTSRMDTLNVSNYVTRTINTSSSFILRGSIDSDMFEYLYNLLPKLFVVDAKLAKIIINNINAIIDITDHYDKPLTKEEWFIYLYLIKKSTTEDFNFKKIIELIDLDGLISQIKFKSEPLGKHYKIMNNIINEVKENVQ